MLREAGVQSRLQHLQYRLLDQPVEHARNAELAHSAVALGNLPPQYRLGLVGSAKQLLAGFLPMLHQVLRQFFHRHSIDSGTAPVLSHPRQRRPDVAARDHLFQQVVASRAPLSVGRRRRFATALDLRGFTSSFQPQPQLRGLLALGVFRTHSGSLSLPFGPSSARTSRLLPYPADYYDLG